MKFSFKDILVERKLFAGDRYDISPAKKNRTESEAKEFALWGLADIVGSFAIYMSDDEKAWADQDAILALFREIFISNFDKITTAEAIEANKDTRNPQEEKALDSLDYKIKGNTISGSIRYNGRSLKGKTKFTAKDKNTSGIFFQN